MDRKSTIAGHAGIIGTGRSLYVASLFILNIGLARSLGPEGFGSFQQVFMLNVLFMILTLGIPETMFFFLPRLKSEERPGFIGQTIIILAFSGFGTALLFWFGSSLFAALQRNPSVASSIRLFGIYGASIIISSCFDPVFIMFKRIRYLFILSTLHALFFIALTLWVHIMKGSPEPLFGAVAVFGALKLVLGMLFLMMMRKETGPVTFSMRHNSILLQLSFAFPIGLSNSIDIISRWLDKFVVSSFLGSEALGIFYVGAIEIPFVSVFVASLYNVVSPKLNDLHHAGDYEGFKRLVGGTLKLTAMCLWPLFAYLFTFADHLISLVFTSTYLKAAETFRIYLLLMPIRIFLFGVIIIALGKPGIVLWASLGSTLLNFVLNIFLVQAVGFNGPAIATVVSTYLQVIVLIWSVLINLKTSLARLLPVKHFFSIGVSSLIAAMLSFILTKQYSSDMKVIVLSLTIFCGTYIFLGIYGGFLRVPGLFDLTEGGSHGKKNKDSDA